MANTYPIASTRTMVQMLQQLYPAQSFLKRKFFKRTNLIDTKYVDIDIFKGKRRTATYVSPLEKGKPVSKIGWVTQSYEPPYIKQLKEFTPSEIIDTRSPGDTIYQDETPMQRAERLYALALADLDDMTTRAEELQAAQGLFSGKVTLLDGNNLVFPQAPTHQITDLAYLWTDTDHSNPLTDLRKWHRMVSKDSGIVPDTVVLGFDATTAYMEHPKVSGNTGALSSIKVTRGEINPQLQPEGVTYLGYIAEIGCDLYSYNAYYIPADAPDDSEPVPMVPDNLVWMGSSAMRADVNYAAIQDIEAGLVPLARFPKMWDEKDPSKRNLLMQSAPLLVPVQVDSYMFAEVV